jgi:hypothetical protein
VSLLLLLLACGDGGGDSGPEGGVVLLTPREQLIRLSVELRGVHPAPEDLATIDADPDAYEDFVDAWLEDPRFAGRIRELYEERWLLHTGSIRFDPASVGVSADNATVAATIAEEPLRLISGVIEADLPITTILTADTTVADETLALLWDLDYPAGASGWQEARYQDGRPAAGVLSTTALWQRYQSKGDNANRARANAVARLLLCDDYLDTPIILDADAVASFVTDAEASIASNPTCQGCHVTLDPLAANLFGFYNAEDPSNLTEERTYRPENEGLWEEHAGQPPGFYGAESSGLADLGAQIAADPRFRSCMVHTLWEGMGQRRATDADWSELQALMAVFDEEGLRVKPLIRAMALSDAWRAASFVDPATDDRIPTLRVASPTQIAAIVEDLTGFEMLYQGRAVLTEPTLGLPPLLGGVDAKLGIQRSYVPAVTGAVLMRELARAAAHTVVEHDLDPGREGDARLLGLVTADDRPDADPALFEAQMAALYERVTGLPVVEGSTLPARLVSLWSDAYLLESSPETAWKVVVAAVLRDPRVLFY